MQPQHKTRWVSIVKIIRGKWLDSRYLPTKAIFIKDIMVSSVVVIDRVRVSD